MQEDLVTKYARVIHTLIGGFAEDDNHGVNDDSEILFRRSSPAFLYANIWRDEDILLHRGNEGELLLSADVRYLDGRSELYSASFGDKIPLHADDAAIESHIATLENEMQSDRKQVSAIIEECIRWESSQGGVSNAEKSDHFALLTERIGEAKVNASKLPTGIALSI